MIQRPNRTEVSTEQAHRGMLQEIAQMPSALTDEFKFVDHDTASISHCTSSELSEHRDKVDPQNLA